jgi:putative transposase
VAHFEVTKQTMRIVKAFRFRVYPDAAQIARLGQWESALRFLWNLALEQRIAGYARAKCERVYPTAFDQIGELTELRAELPWLADVPRNAIDRGITNFGATSDGDMNANPRNLEVSLACLARAQRNVSRKKKGSKNRDKAKARVAVLHRKVRRRRDHFLHVQSARLAKSHGVVVLEKLNVAGMIRGRCARQIADAGWSRFAEMLRYKLAWSGGSLVEVPAAYSSQTCSTCGCVDAESRRSQSVFRCTSCDYQDHADLNAAKILLSRANRSGKPVDGTAPEAAGRSRKRVALRVPRRAPESYAL